MTAGDFNVFALAYVVQALISIQGTQYSPCFTLSTIAKPCTVYVDLKDPEEVEIVKLYQNGCHH